MMWITQPIGKVFKNESSSVSIHCTSTLVIRQQVNTNKGNKEMLSDITQSHLNICEEGASDSWPNCEGDNMYYTDQAELIQDFCHGQGDTTSDTDQVNVIQDSFYDSADQVETTYDTDQADMTDDTDQADMTDDIDQSDGTHDTDNASTDSVSCSDTSDEEQSINTNSEVQSLYSGSNITNQDFSVALLSLSHKHSLTNSCVVDILNLFLQVLPTSLPNQLPKSYHVLMKEFVDYSRSVIVHRCCGYCSRLLSLNSICDMPECLMANVAESSFIQVAIDKQLQTLFSGKNSTVASWLQHVS